MQKEKTWYEKRFSNQKGYSLILIFETQMNANLEKSLLTDGLFNFTYLVMNAEMPILEFPSSNERYSELITVISNSN